jgi:hypothetical protein
MAELKKTISGRFQGSHASNLVSLPIRRNPVVEPSSSSNQSNQKNQSKAYLNPRFPGESTIPGPDLETKVKSKGTASTSEQKDVHLKPLVLDRAASATRSIRQTPPYTHSTLSPQTFQQNLSMNRPSGSTGPAQPHGHGFKQHTIVDLTSDSDDDDMYRANDPPKRVKAAGSELSFASQPKLLGQGNMLDSFGPPPSNTPRQDQMFHDDEAFARALQEEFALDLPASGQGPQVSVSDQSTTEAEMVAPNAAVDPLVDCMQVLESVFPGICIDHVSELFNTVSKSSEQLIDHILSKGPYPRAKALKRKRELDLDEEAARKYGALNRIIPDEAGGIRPFM